jgi:hypothetical protein
MPQYLNVFIHYATQVIHNSADRHTLRYIFFEQMSVGVTTLIKENRMSPQRIAGLALLAIGLVLFIVGLNASHSFADQLSNTFTGKFTDSTAWYVYGGLAMAVAGSLLASFGGNTSKHA